MSLSVALQIVLGVWVKTPVWSYFVLLFNYYYTHYNYYYCYYYYHYYYYY